MSQLSHVTVDDGEVTFCGDLEGGKTTCDVHVARSEIVIHCDIYEIILLAYDILLLIYIVDN